MQHNISLRSFNTFAIDVKADTFIEITDSDSFIDFLSKNKLSKNRFVLGGGSNLLFTKDYEGTILKNGIKGISIVSETEEEVVL